MTVAHLPFESRTGHDPALGIGVAAVESVWVAQADKRVINDVADVRPWPGARLPVASRRWQTRHGRGSARPSFTIAVARRRWLSRW